MVVRLRPHVNLTDDQLYEISRANRELRFERTAAGELVIMPAGGESGRRNFNLTGALFVWSQRDGRGIGFDSSAGFRLASGAVRSPDAAWMRRERYDALTSLD